MIKSYRDVKSGLAISRERKVTYRTSQIESSLRKEIEGKYGDLSRLTGDVAFREKARKQRQRLSLERSRLSLFINKERRSRLQRERSSPLDSEKSPPKKDDFPERFSPKMAEAQKFRKVEFKY